MASAVLCLAVAPVTLARLLGGEHPFPGPVLAAAAPFAPIALLPALLLAGAGRWRAAAAVPGVLLAVHLSWLAPSLVPDGGPAATARGAEQPRELTVMSANLRYGEAGADAVVRAVRDHAVDVLAVQELTPEAVRRFRAAGLEELLPSSVLSPAAGAGGTGLWSRAPVTPLPPIPGTTSATPRARLALPDGSTITLTSAHPSAPSTQDGIPPWRRDLAILRTALDATTGLQIVAGDFNATRDHRPFRRLLDVGLTDAADAAGVAAWPGMTWPAHRRFPPVMRLDHVLVSPGIAVRDVTNVTLPGTDHRSVVARLVLPG